MKQRILSILTALALCLTLLPTAALADSPTGISGGGGPTKPSFGGDGGTIDTGGSPTITICNHALGEGGKCTECGETLIAEVTKTTENGGTDTYYLAETGITDPNSDEDDDLALIQKTFLDSSTTKVKLLADVKTAGHVAGIGFYSPNQTLDLNGHTLDTVGGSIFLVLQSDNDDAPAPSVTITDSGTEKDGALKGYRVYIYDGTLTIDSGTLTVEKSSGNSSTDTDLITIEGGSMTVSGTAKVDCSTITVAGYTDNDTGVTTPGSLTVQDSAKITGGITVNENGTLTMTGGTVEMHTIDEDAPMDTSTFLYVNGGTAKISGGEIDGLMLASGSVELSGGTYKAVAAYGGSATDLLKNGYAYFAKAEGSATYNTLTAPTLLGNTLSIVENVAVKSHECNFSLNDETGKYTCDCGRTATQQPITYVDKDGDTAYCMEYTELDESYVKNQNSNDFTVGTQTADCWYVVKNDLTVNGKMNIEGYYAGLHLILCDGATLTVAGISGSNTNSMTIYGQSGGNGKLVTNDPTTGGRGYGIQVSNGLTINGGVIKAGAPNAEFGYGIYVTGDLTVNGGTVTATGGKTTVAENETTGKNYCGIYVYEGDVTVNGGSVTATGGEIRGECEDYCNSYGMEVDCGGIKVTGGTVNATGGKVSITHTDEAQINEQSCGIAMEYGTKLAVSGGTVTATGGTVSAIGENVHYGDSYGARIYGEVEVSGSGTLDCTGGAVTMRGKGCIDMPTGGRRLTRIGKTYPPDS